MSAYENDQMDTYELNDEEVLLHFNIFNTTSKSTFNRLIKNGKLKELISQQDKLIDDFVCLRNSGRCVDQSSLLLCAGIYYLLHEKKRQYFCEKVNDICKIPTDLFKLMNVVSNEININSNFNCLDDFKDLKVMIKTNALKGKKKKKKKKKMGKRKHESVSDAGPAKKVKVSTVSDISEGIGGVTLNLTPDEIDNIREFIEKHKFIEQWYVDPKKTAADLLYMLTKFKTRCGWDHKIILHYSHFKFKGKGLPVERKKKGLPGGGNRKMKGNNNSYVGSDEMEAMDVQIGEDSKCNPHGKGGDCNMNYVLSGKTNLDDDANIANIGSNLSEERCDDKLGNINLVINYILHGVNNIKKVKIFQDYFDRCHEPGYKPEDLPVDEITSRVIAAIYVLEKSKMNGETCCESLEEKIAEHIRRYKRVPQVSTPYGGVLKKIEQKGGETYTMALGCEDISYCFGSNSRFVDESADGVLDRFHFCAEHLPTPLYSKPKIWKALMKDLPITAFICHICYIAGLGLLDESDKDNAENVQVFLDVLRCPNRLKRVHPFQILKALMEYMKVGIRTNVKKGRKWEVNHTIYKALCEAFCLSLRYCPRGMKDSEISNFSNRKYKVCIEASRAMMSPHFIGNPKLSGTRAAVAMAHVIQNFCKNIEIYICGGEKMYQPGERVGIKLEGKNEGKGKNKWHRKCAENITDNMSNRSDLSDASDLITRLYRIQLVAARHTKKNINQLVVNTTPPPLTRPDAQRSNLAQPITEAIAKHEIVDAFIVFTMSNCEELVGRSPYHEFVEYKENVNPNAKLIICTMEVMTHIIADPSDPSVKVLCGVDAYLLHEIIQFMNADPNTTTNLCKFCCTVHKPTQEYME